jgi:hypothetical protein
MWAGHQTYRKQGANAKGSVAAFIGADIDYLSPSENVIVNIMVYHYK